MSVAWEDPISVVSGSDIVCWADKETPLEVALLAMAGSAVEGSKIGGELKVGVAKIEDRRNSHSGPGGDRKKMQKSARKGSRELKNLISIINYDAGGSKKQGFK